MKSLKDIDNFSLLRSDGLIFKRKNINTFDQPKVFTLSSLKLLSD